MNPIFWIWGGVKSILGITAAEREHKHQTTLKFILDSEKLFEALKYAKTKEDKLKALEKLRDTINNDL